jgi:hypothetical protein
MGTAVVQADTLIGVTDHAVYAVDTHGTVMWRQTSNKNCTVCGLWSFVANIVNQRLASCNRQRQTVLAACFSAPERNNTGMPIYIVQLELADFTAS